MDRQARVAAAKNAVLSNNISIYKASRQFNIPETTIRRHCNSENNLSGPGRPRKLSEAQEVELVKYSKDMVRLGFGLTASDMIRCANGMTGGDSRLSWDWWSSFKRRHNLCLRASEPVAHYRATMANRAMMDDFFDKYEAKVSELNLENKPHLIYNLDETGLQIAGGSGRVVAPRGMKRVCSRTYADKSETRTLLIAVSASGAISPGMLLFKVSYNCNILTCIVKVRQNRIL